MTDLELAQDLESAETVLRRLVEGLGRDSRNDADARAELEECLSVVRDWREQLRRGEWAGIGPFP